MKTEILPVDFSKQDKELYEKLAESLRQLTVGVLGKLQAEILLVVCHPF